MATITYFKWRIREINYKPHMCVFGHVQLFVTPWTVACQAPPPFQARILEWVAISSFRGPSRPRDQTCISCIGRRILYHCDTWEARSYLPSCLFQQEDLGSAFSPLHSVGGSRAKRLRGQISESVRTRVKS